MKVIGAGFPRTGTSSMKAALEQLGFGPCHHMFEVYRHPEQIDRWVRAAASINPNSLDPSPVDWDWVLEGYDSAVDWPAGAFWRELADAYPDAKILLTTRDPERWYTSMQNTIFSNFGASAGDLPPTIAPIMGKLLPVFGAIVGRMFGTKVTDDPPSKDEAIKMYEQHAEAVRQTIPSDRLLVHEARDGWAPLCEFLGVEQPAEPYPHLNDSATLQDFMQQLAAGGPVDTPFGQVNPTRPQSGA